MKLIATLLGSGALTACGHCPTQIPATEIRTVDVPVEVVKPLPDALTAPLPLPPALPKPLPFEALEAYVEALLGIIDQANRDRARAAELSKEHAPQ